MPQVTVTRAGISIDGRPFLLLAGQLHYFRYPKAEWRDLLLKARAGGLNTIDTVIPWNRHEIAEGQFDFAEEADLAAYLDLCAELGLYAIVRPGPYICAEWENGGFPAWLTAKPGIELRVDNTVFLDHTLRWFDTLFPLLATRQATSGGPIILCQIENEHWASGRYGHDQHQATLACAAIERGMDVPQYTCMGPMRDWAEFRNGWSGIAEKLQQTRARWPENPMIVSELWSGWFDNWGASRHNHKTAARLDQILHQLTAVGASGWSHWMWAGGTNFGYWGGRTVGGDTIHMTTSYDYDAPVSEYGGLTEKFFVARRHHMFMSTLGARLSAVLADAVAGGPQVIAPAAVAGRGEAGNAPYRNVRAGAGAPAAWADFTATFFQNTGFEGQTYQLFLQQPSVHLPIEVEAGAIKPIFSNLPLGRTKDERRTTNSAPSSFVVRHSSLVLEYHTSRILGFWQHADTDVLVFYGAEGEVGQLQLRVESAELRVEGVIPANSELRTQNSELHLRYWIADRPTVVRLRAGARALTLVLLTTARAERWWPLSDGGYVCGPHLLADADLDGPNLELLLDARGIMPFYHIDMDGQVRMLPGAHPLTPSPPHPRARALGQTRGRRTLRHRRLAADRATAGAGGAGLRLWLWLVSRRDRARTGARAEPGCALAFRSRAGAARRRRHWLAGRASARPTAGAADPADRRPPRSARISRQPGPLQLRLEYRRAQGTPGYAVLGRPPARHDGRLGRAVAGGRVRRRINRRCQARCGSPRHGRCEPG